MKSWFKNSNESPKRSLAFRCWPVDDDRLRLSWPADTDTDCWAAGERSADDSDSADEACSQGRRPAHGRHHHHNQTGHGKQHWPGQHHIRPLGSVDLCSPRLAKFANRPRCTSGRVNDGCSGGGGDDDDNRSPLKSRDFNQNWLPPSGARAGVRNANNRQRSAGISSGFCGGAGRVVAGDGMRDVEERGNLGVRQSRPACSATLLASGDAPPSVACLSSKRNALTDRLQRLLTKSSLLNGSCGKLDEREEEQSACHQDIYNRSFAVCPISQPNVRAADAPDDAAAADAHTGGGGTARHSAAMYRSFVSCTMQLKTEHERRTEWHSLGDRATKRSWFSFAKFSAPASSSSSTTTQQQSSARQQQQQRTQQHEQPVTRVIPIVREWRSGMVDTDQLPRQSRSQQPQSRHQAPQQPPPPPPPQSQSDYDSRVRQPQWAPDENRPDQQQPPPQPPRQRHVHIIKIHVEDRESTPPVRPAPVVHVIPIHIEGSDSVIDVPDCDQETPWVPPWRKRSPPEQQQQQQRKFPLRTTTAAAQAKDLRKSASETRSADLLASHNKVPLSSCWSASSLNSLSSCTDGALSRSVSSCAMAHSPQSSSCSLSSLQSQLSDATQESQVGLTQSFSDSNCSSSSSSAYLSPSEESAFVAAGGQRPSSSGGGLSVASGRNSRSSDSISKLTVNIGAAPAANRNVRRSESMSSDASFRSASISRTSSSSSARATVPPAETHGQERLERPAHDKHQQLIAR